MITAILAVALGVTILSGWVVGNHLMERLDQADQALVDLENLLVENEIISIRDLVTHNILED